MKKKSLGSLSALAALCASGGSADGAVVVSGTIDNEVVVSPATGPGDGLSVSFDIDGDDTDDIEFWSSLNSSVLTANNDAGIVSSVAVRTDNFGQAKGFSVGDMVDVSQEFSPGPTIHSAGNFPQSLLTDGTAYLGVEFSPGGGGISYAVLELVTTLDGTNGGVFDMLGDSVILKSATWETESNTAITVVPEASVSLLTLGGLAGACLRRRRRA